MNFLPILESLNYGLVMIYGLFLSIFFVGGCKNRRQQRFILLLCPIFLAIQLVFSLLWGPDLVRQIYPLIVHLPLMLVLIFVLKSPTLNAFVSVLTAYLCCQLPRWVMLAVSTFSGSALAGEICYTLSIFPIFYLLYRFFTQAAYEAMTSSVRLLLLFGSLPFVYYLFDYATTVYSNAINMANPALIEFFPTALIVFYILFLAAYHAQSQKYMKAKLQGSMLAKELAQSGLEIEALRKSQAQTAIYQHDMRHHLNTIDSFLAAGKPQQAADYIQTVRADVDAITPKRFCEHELVNLLCSSFSERAHRLEVRLSITAKLPKELSISDTELCSLLSNGLENALTAVSGLPEPLKWVELYCEVKLGKFLLEIKNPCHSRIIMRNGLPVSSQEGHGYGCRSIRTITEHHRGLCSFDAENGLFALRVVIPM